MTGLCLVNNRYFKPPPVGLEALVKNNIMIHVIQAYDELLEGIGS